MKEAIKSIIDWNITCWNTREAYNRHLENSLLIEEFAETITALKENDKIEAVDGILDMFWVGIWTLYKMWISEEQIYNSFKEIEKSNYSKLIKDWDNYKVIKDSQGKILKPEWFFKPDLTKFF
jgi:predicted HAD superfamily Cof-like phosphohydrolase